MTSTTDQPQAPKPNAVCGNCGRPVPNDAITCPHCTVLLAAYQSTMGSQAASFAPADSSMTHFVPSAETVAETFTPKPPVTPPPAVPPVRQRPSADTRVPSRHNPTGPRRGSATPPLDAAAELRRMASGRDDLSNMADGKDELSDMADGNDELSQMASGRDELSDMASEGTVPFKDAVNAELAGAKVVFTDNQPIIEAAQVEVINPGTGAPDVIGHAPSSASATVSAPTSRPAQEPSPSRVASAPSWDSIPETGGTSQQFPSARNQQATSAQNRRPPASRGQQSRATQPSVPSVSPTPIAAPQPPPLLRQLTGWLPFVLILCVVLSIGRGVGWGLLIGALLTMGLVVYGLVKVVRQTARKTTSMPRDDARRR